MHYREGFGADGQACACRLLWFPSLSLAFFLSYGLKGPGSGCMGAAWPGLCAPLLLLSAWVAWFDVAGAAFRGGCRILIRCVST